MMLGKSLVYYLLSFMLLIPATLSHSNSLADKADSEKNSEQIVPVVALLLDPCVRVNFPLQYSRWPEPLSSLTLPVLTPGKGYYYPDIQASFPNVDWQGLDRLYIPAGHYPFINIGNLPDRMADKPLIITNQGGQVRVGGLGHYYLFTLGGGRNWILTGRYDPIAQTGNSKYRGHWQGAYAQSRGSYGFLVDDEFVRESVSGLGVGSRATDFEIEFIEIRQVGFAGMVVKTDDDGSATMENIKIHDTYIHDTLSEGFYIGSTQKQPQHLIRNLELYNNRVIRSGTEAIQIGNLGGEVHIHNNVFALSAVHWKDAFQPWQDGNLQVGIRSGNLTIEDNLFIGAAGNMLFSSAQQVSGDSYPPSSTILIRRNYFSSTRNLFFYLRNDSFPGLRYRIENNYFTNMQFQRSEIDTAAIAPQHLIRTFTPVPLEFLENVYDVDLHFSSQLNSGNGTFNNVTGSGNSKRKVPEMEFCRSGFPKGFDYLKLEVWAEKAGRGGDSPIHYEMDDIVMYKGIPYRCLLRSCSPGRTPPESPAAWQAMSYFPDDWRSHPASGELKGIGLLY